MDLELSDGEISSEVDSDDDFNYAPEDQSDSEAEDQEENGKSDNGSNDSGSEATSYPGSFFGEGKTLVGAGYMPPRFWVVN